MYVIYIFGSVGLIKPLCQYIPRANISLLVNHYHLIASQFKCKFMRTWIKTFILILTLKSSPTSLWWGNNIIMQMVVESNFSCSTLEPQYGKYKSVVRVGTNNHAVLDNTLKKSNCYVSGVNFSKLHILDHND